MTLSSTQRCSSKRLMTGAPLGLRFDQSRPCGVSAAAAGVTTLPMAGPIAAASDPVCMNARRSMTFLLRRLLLCGRGTRIGSATGIEQPRVPALILIYDRGPTTAGDKAQSWRTKTKCKPAYLGVHIVALVDLGLPNC